MIHVKRMKPEHLEQVYALEIRSFAIPWSKNDLREEIYRKNAYYLVALDAEETVVGYAGMWHIVNEGHINNIAVDESHRGQGIGSLLMEGLIHVAKNKDMIGLTLEVRVGNRAAQYLYSKYGFKVEGYRKNYYADTKEDAVIMWKYF